jgi:hypothetical protein
MHATAPCKSPDRWLQILLFWRSLSFVELVSPLGLVDEMRSIYFQAAASCSGAETSVKRPKRA